MLPKSNFKIRNNKGVKKIKIKNLELGRRINQVVTILICAVVIPVFLIFLAYPDFLIPGYSYDEYASLYLIYTILFVFFLALVIGINAIVKRYIKRSMEEKQVINKENVTNEGKLKICSSCGAEILDKTGDFCSKCGSLVK